MPTPVVQPSCGCLNAEPGEVRTMHFTIVKAPSSAQVTASVVGGAPHVKLKHLVALELVTRPMTAEEIAELPPFPPSIRINAQAHGISEFEEVGRSDGGPLAVTAGAQVRFEVEFTAPQPPPPAVVTAMFVVEGSTWVRVEAPMVFLTGTATALPAVEPAKLCFALEPGETHTQDVVIAKAPQAATAVSCIGTGGPIVRVKAVVAFLPVQKYFTPEEVNELPPYPPNIREDAVANGFIEYQETGRADGCKPLAVPAGSLLKVYVEFAAPAQGAPDVVSTKLEILGTTWYPVEVPTFLIIGKVETVLSAAALSVRQGDSTDLPLQVTSIAGPATLVHFELGHQDGGKWQVSPPVLHLPRGATVSITVKVVVAPETALGVYDVGFRVLAFERLQTREFPFKLTVLPGRVSVQALQSSVAGVQGGTATCKIRVSSTGGSKRMNFLAGTLPDGVQLYAPDREFGPGAATLEFDLVFTVGMFARPVTNAHTLVYWFVDDGEHAGFLDLPITVTLTFQTRTFGQPVVTPAGTALGGYAELVLTNSGNCRFRGYMKATGLPSYKFRVRAVLRSSNGLLTVAAQKTGEAKGWLDPGSSQFDWDEPIFSQLVADRWADMQSASMVASKSYEMSGVLGTYSDLLVDWFEYLAANIVIGPVAGVIFLGSELGALTGWQWAGPGGLVGLGVAGGVAFLTGPTMIIPAMIGGTLVGSQLIKSRAMTAAEKDFAATVFGDTLPTDRIVLTNLIGLGDAPFTIPGVDGSILVNMGDSGYDSPLTQPLYPGYGYTVGGQVFIHELTHAWQIAHWPLTIGYFWEAAMDNMDLPNAARYGPAGPPWSSFGQEEQAKIVDHWFAGVTFYARRPPPTRSAMDPNDPYFTYIANNIRMGQP